MRSAGVQLEIAGAASIPARDLDLKGVATLVSTPSSDRKSFELPFVVQGPWDDPLMLPDAQILIQRSGAAAPLLDALRGRNEREAVRPATAAPFPPPAAARPTAPRETEAVAPAAAPQENEAAPAAAAAARTQEAAVPATMPEPPVSDPPVEESTSGNDGAPDPAPAVSSPAPAEKPE